MVAELCDSDNHGPSISTVLARAVAVLSDAGVTEAQRDARRLMAWAAELEPAALGIALHERRALPAAAAARFEAAVARRADRVPVSQIVGGRWFYGRWFAVTPAVLDPRPESETLVAQALAHLPVDRPARLLDLGAGSGCLLLSVLAERPEAAGEGVDVSADALAVAARNAAALGLSARAVWRRADWLTGAVGRFDAILCNPPYIPEAAWRDLAPEVRRHEPKGALTPGPDGLEVYRRLAPRIGSRLAPGGAAFFEVGAGQAAAVAALFDAAGLTARCAADLDGRDRVVWVRP